MAKVQVLLRMDEEMKSALDTLAEKEDRTAQFLIIRAAQEMLDKATTTKPAPKSLPAAWVSKVVIHDPPIDADGMVTVPIRVSDATWSRLKNYRWRIRAGSTDEAADKLLRMGLKQAGKKSWSMQDAAD